MPLPEIIAYHPNIHVDKDGELVVATLSVKEYGTEEEVIKKAAESLKVDTVGELVEALQKQGAEVKTVGATKSAVATPGHRIWKWSEKIK